MFQWEKGCIIIIRMKQVHIPAQHCTSVRLWYVSLSTFFSSLKSRIMLMLETAWTIVKNLGFFKNLFLIGGKLLYNVVLVSTIRQCKLAMIIHISTPSWLSPCPHFIPSISVITEGQAALPVLYSNLSPAGCFTVVVGVCQCYFLCLSHSLLPSCVHSLPSMSASPFLPCK